MASVNSAITKTGLEFTATGNMWSAIYDSRFDENIIHEMIVTELQMAFGSKDGAVMAGSKSKKDYLIFQNPTIKGLLNTNDIVRIEPESEKLVMMTGFPELSTKSSLQAKLLAVREYGLGFEAGLEVEVITDAEGTHNTAKILNFFDTRYIVNRDKYKIGQVYKFHIGALITNIKHRSQASLNIPLNDQSRKVMKTEQKTLSTKDMFALNPSFDDNPEAFYALFKFDGLHPKSFHHPLLAKKNEMYLFKIRCQFLGENKPTYELPAIMTDGVIVTSYEQDKNNKRRKVEFAEGDAVDANGVLQGYLIGSA